MSKISGGSGERIFQIRAWGGLNENPDGDTKLKLGEAAAMRNFTVTRDGNLRRRPGSKTMVSMGDQPVHGLWTGYVNGREELVAACGGKLWRLWDAEAEQFIREEIGSLDTQNEVYMFGFSNILYLLNGTEYRQWDGTALADVEGYRPLVTITVPPGGGGETLEQVNKLTGTRRCWLSPDGEGKRFQLPEKGLASLDWVMDLKTGEKLSADEYSFDLTEGTVTFPEAPAQAVNRYEIAWTMAESFRGQVSAMRYGELYSGTQDTRVFLYGDGTNRAVYSGLDYDGKPRADYFPDMNEVRVGDENTPITALIRHYSALVCFKTNSAWAIQYGIVTLADGSLTPAFYTTPINRSIGSEALGQVRLVLNAPWTLHGSDLFEWRNNSSYSSNLSVDERQAKRISDRIYASLGTFDFKDCYCWDDNDHQEYYLCYGERALVCNYAADAWYYYEGLDVSCMANFRGELYFGSRQGELKHLSYDYLSDDGRAVDAYWESGSMSFGQDYMRKYSAQIWVGIKPESNGEVTVTVQTDRKGNYTEKLVASTMSTFRKANFARWSFGTNRKPRMTRLKIKAKKFVFYKLIFQAAQPDTTVTMLAADIRVRFTGYAK